MKKGVFFCTNFDGTTSIFVSSWTFVIDPSVYVFSGKLSLLPFGAFPSFSLTSRMILLIFIFPKNYLSQFFVVKMYSVFIRKVCYFQLNFLVGTTWYVISSNCHCLGKLYTTNPMGFEHFFNISNGTLNRSLALAVSRFSIIFTPSHIELATVISELRICLQRCFQNPVKHLRWSFCGNG